MYVSFPRYCLQLVMCCWPRSARHVLLSQTNSLRMLMTQRLTLHPVTYSVLLFLTPKALDWLTLFLEWQASVVSNCVSRQVSKRGWRASAFFSLLCVSDKHETCLSSAFFILVGFLLEKRLSSSGERTENHLFTRFSGIFLQVSQENES